MNPFDNLQPRAVWAHFATLCAIPRPSLREAALREHLIAWAARHGIASQVDGAGNLILRKPASPGGESAAGVVLQAHLDMVCQANAGTSHDFEHDPIRAVVRDGWALAENTTLGADNGIGVALALAVLEAPDLVHPALEVLLTVNEESGTVARTVPAGLPAGVWAARKPAGDSRLAGVRSAGGQPPASGDDLLRTGHPLRPCARRRCRDRLGGAQLATARAVLQSLAGA